MTESTCVAATVRGINVHICGRAAPAAAQGYCVCASHQALHAAGAEVWILVKDPSGCVLVRPLP